MNICVDTVKNKIKKEIRINKKFHKYATNHFLQGITEGMIIILDWLENKETKELFYEQGDIDIPKKVCRRKILRQGEK